MTRRRAKRPFVKPVRNCKFCSGSGWEQVEGKDGVTRCRCLKKQMDAILGGANLSQSPEELHTEYFNKNFRAKKELPDDPPVQNGKSSAYKD